MDWENLTSMEMQQYIRMLLSEGDEAQISASYVYKASFSHDSHFGCCVTRPHGCSRRRPQTDKIRSCDKFSNTLIGLPG
jgi:hypothetical protein